MGEDPTMSTPCDSIRDDLVAYADGELTASERERVGAHLASCVACRRELDAHRRVWEALDRLPGLSARPGWTDEVEERILGPRVRPFPLWRRGLAALALAAAVALAAGLGWLLARPGPATSPQRLALDRPAPRGPQGSPSPRELVRPRRSEGLADPTPGQGVSAGRVPRRAPASERTSPSRREEPSTGPDLARREVPQATEPTPPPTRSVSREDFAEELALLEDLSDEELELVEDLDVVAALDELEELDVLENLDLFEDLADEELPGDA
ncbi:MAG: hypothetical protein D6731_20715 [Planctomycetota bacterium]|nr:MAG: hypothetical protein D6731_20715 [Planctomycetota bacterium]